MGDSPGWKVALTDADGRRSLHSTHEQHTVTSSRTHNRRSPACPALPKHTQILETKVRKLEQLVKLKDAKIQTLVAKLQAAGLA